MPRSRNIKPQFFKNEHLATISPHARLLFIGLWCLADCKGRLQDRPLRIKAELFPYENMDIEAVLNELAQSEEKFIIRYEVEGNRYIEIPNFRKHQNPHKGEKETGSHIPPNPLGIQDESGASTVQASDRHRTNPADSPLLIPDSLTPDAGTGDVGVGDLAKGNDSASAMAKKGADYLLSLNSPNHPNTAWVSGFLKIQFEELASSRPELNPGQVLSCWHDVCDLAVAKNATAPQWLKTAFKNKLQALTPEVPSSSSSAIAAKAVSALLAFPFILHSMTGEIFNSKDMNISLDAPNGLTHKQGGYFPFGQLEGRSEVSANA